MTKTELINLLRDYYKKHGKKPMRKDMPKEVVKATKEYFGSWKQCLKDLNITNKKYTKKDIENEILNYHNKYSKAPKMSELDSRLISFIKIHYGTYNKLLKTLDLQENVNHIKFSLEYIEKRLLTEYTDKNLKSYKEFRGNDEKMPTSVAVFNNHFGIKWSEFLVKIGFEYATGGTYIIRNDEELLEKYRKLSEKLGYPANSVEIENSKITPTYSVYYYRFRDLENLKKRAGYDYDIAKNRYTKEKIKNILIEEYKQNNNERLTVKQILKNKNMPSVDTIKRHFLAREIGKVWSEIEEEVNKEN